MSPGALGAPADVRVADVVAVTRLSHCFGTNRLTRQVLCNVDLSVQRGEVVLLTGPSGSGKTTLLTLVGGLRAVQDGSCIVLGQQLRDAKEKERIALRRRIGFIFQDHHLLGFLTAAQNVAMALEHEKSCGEYERRLRSAAMLDKVGLGDFQHAVPSQMSGGQRQRVAVARALVREPELIIADEPTAALDGRTGRELVELMTALARERDVALLMVTHDMRIIEIADRTLALEDGLIRHVALKN